MNTVTTISLAGRSYAFEESGYQALRSYLDQAAENLAGNPDKEEILKDFELAIAEKCEKYLSPNKNVVTAGETKLIIDEMGPVEGNSAKSSSSTDRQTSGNDSATAKPKKLYRIPEGEMISGVCTGIAAYFGIDVTLVRIIFVLLTVFTSGIGVLIYILMLVIVPVATTSEQKDRASGASPVTAQDILQRAKEKAQEGYANFKNSGEWKRWKQQMKEEGRRWKYNRRQSPFYELLQNVMGFVWLAFIVWIAWFGYNHSVAVHQTFDLIANLWLQLIDKIAGRFNK